MIPQISLFAESLSKAFNLLYIVDFEETAGGRLVLEQEGNEHGPLGMCVDAAGSVAFGEGGHEEGGALGGFERGWGAEVDSFFWVVLGGHGKNVDVFGLHEFF